MYNDDNNPFKKMDLNFDPTQESKVEPKLEENNKDNLEKSQDEKKEISSLNKEQPKEQEGAVEQPEVKKESEAIIKEDISQPIIEPKEEPKKSMDKTLEFIIQNDPINTDLTIDEKADAKAAEKKAKKHRKISFFWVFICLLTIIFGIEAIWAYAGDIKNLINAINDENKGLVMPIFWVIVNGFEPLLYVFFIILSMVKYQKNHKPYVQWWDDTEPIRVTAEIQKQKDINLKHLQRFNALGLHNTYTKLVSENLHDELKNLKEENKFLANKIKEKEDELAEKAKQAKAEAKK